MRLCVNLGGEIFPSTKEEVDKKIEEIFTSFPENVREGNSAQVWFSFVGADPVNGDTFRLEHSNLLLYLDIDLGFGIAVWNCDSVVGAEMVNSGKVKADENVWVSLASHRPHSTAKVLLDPWTGAVADPRTILTFAELKTVSEEFCHAGSGFRPESIAWTPGHPTGEVI